LIFAQLKTATRWLSLNYKITKFLLRSKRKIV